MCVIIEKIAGKEVPYEHLLAGAYRNSDGFGVAVQDRGRVEIIRGLGTPTDAASQVAKILSEAKDLQAYAHFRYRTVGDVNVDNTHPIVVLAKDKDGIDLHLMHNGTISGFKGDDRSDSVIFAEEILAPLARRCAKYIGPEDVTSDPLLASVLGRYAEGVSKFVLLDSNGNSMIINRLKGAEKDYGWVSNEYSIAASNIPTTGTSSNVRTMRGWTKHLRTPPFSMGTETSHQALVNTLNAQKDNKPCFETACPTVRLTVEEITGHKPQAFKCLDMEQLRGLTGEEPDLAAILIADLLYLVHQSDFAKKAA